MILGYIIKALGSCVCRSKTSDVPLLGLVNQSSNWHMLLNDHFSISVLLVYSVATVKLLYYTVTLLCY